MELRDAVGSNQFGVMRRAGCELVHKCVTALTDEDASRAVVAFDCTNAFNTLPRGRVCEAVRSRLPALSHTANAWLTQRVVHMCWDEVGVCHPTPATRG
eukprot:7634366-Karenia_brevis.AAC.1